VLFNQKGTIYVYEPTKLDAVPAWLGGMFACIDKKDVQGARKYLADEAVFEFAHYTGLRPHRI